MALVVPPVVVKQMRSMPRQDAWRMLAALEQVAADPGQRFPFVTELKGRPGAWRLRKGDWRAVYVIEDGDVLVAAVAHRKEVYE